MPERTGHAPAPVSYPRLHGRQRRLFPPCARLSGRSRRACAGKCRHPAKRCGHRAPLPHDTSAHTGRSRPQRPHRIRAEHATGHHRSDDPEGRNQPDCRKRAAPRHPSALPLGHGRHARPSAAQRRRARGRIQHGRTPLPHRARPPAPRRHSGVVYPCHHERTAHRRTDLRLCRLYSAGA